ncbi:MAG TPA: 2-phosphosulfolactate phosphatase [Chitinophagaceae bacterium]|jgi:2-phosphosulfolactate phosphatase|nr:2-phosphosulfolactate phosphatase [Chitinophagaceae bacterium]
MALPKIETCLSPSLLHLYDIKDSIVVIIDVFRATSTIAAALHQGAKEILPVDDVDRCIELGTQIENSITAGERDGKVAPGLQHGNSPLEYPRTFIENKTLVLTTTNGTRLLHMCSEANEIITGSFLNLGAVCDYLIAQKKPVLLACASWKDRYNLEDSLFAGAVYDTIGDHFEMNCDSTRAATHLYRQAKNNLYEFIQDSSHFLRLSKFGLQYDMEYCCKINQHNVLVKLVDGKLIRQ